MGLRQYGLFINGTLEPPSGEQIEVGNPATGETVAVVPEASLEDVARAVAAARSAFENGWGTSSPRERSEILRRIAQLIRERGEALVEMEVFEVGRPVSEITAYDIPETADCFDYFASAIRVARGHTIPVTGPYFDFTTWDPVGVVGQITPWNFPLLTAAWKMAPALAMGNAVVLKPSELTPSTALELAGLASEAGLPAGALNVITGRGATVGQALVEHPGVDMIAFTGGPVTGRSIAEAAGRGRKKVTLELGGKSAHILFADCRLDAAVSSVLEGIFYAQGESCSAGSRLLVERPIRDEVIARLRRKAERLVIGRPTDPTTQIGCLISSQHFARVQSCLEQAAQEGIELITCGRVPKEAAFAGRPFMAPTLVIDPLMDSRIVQEEVFGPVLTINSFEGEEEAVRLAHATHYDLAAGLWTNDVTRAHRLLRQLRAGSVWVNTYNRTFNEAPFGGFGASGYGRDLGLEAMVEYGHVKNVCISLAPGSDDWFVLEG